MPCLASPLPFAFFADGFLLSFLSFSLLDFLRRVVLAGIPSWGSNHTWGTFGSRHIYRALWVFGSLALSLSAVSSYCVFFSQLFFLLPICVWFIFVFLTSPFLFTGSWYCGDEAGRPMVSRSKADNSNSAVESEKSNSGDGDATPMNTNVVSSPAPPAAIAA